MPEKANTTKPMCIVLFQWQPDSDTPLILAANRDEFHARPAEAARWRGDIFCGLDLRAGGTWLGVSRDGRFATVTNYREPLEQQQPGNLSRGDLPLGFLQGTLSPQDYCQQVAKHQGDYGPFNLLVGDRRSLWYLGNKGAAPQAVTPGLHGLSNGLMDMPWPKVERGKALLQKAIDTHADEDALLAILRDQQRPEPDELPDTGVPHEMERLLSSIFIVSPAYGTRASTLLKLAAKGEPWVSEYNWTPDGVSV